MRSATFALRAQRRSPEAEIQKRVAAMLRAYLPAGVWWSASLSGVKLTPQIASQAKAAGMQKGAPDISFIWPDGRTTYTELKSDDGTLTPEQKALEAVLGDAFAVCRSWDEVRAAVSAWMPPDMRWLTDAESVKREYGRRAA